MRSLFSPSFRTLHVTLLFALALLVRTWRALQQPVVNPDAIRFIEQARRLATDPIGALRGEPYHPLHSLCTLGLHAITGRFFADDRHAWLFSVQSIGILCGAIVAVQILWFARAFGAPFWASLGASLVWIVGRRTSAYGADGLSDMLFLSLFAAAILLAIRACRFRDQFTGRHTLQFLLAGFLAGLAYLTRPEGLAALLILIAFLLSALVRTKAPAILQRKLFRRRAESRRHIHPAIVALLVGFALPAAPYMFIIRGITQKKTLSMSLLSHAHHLPFAIAAAFAPPVNKGILEKLAMELFETFGFGPWLALIGAMLIAPRLWGRPRLRPLVFIWFCIWTILMVWLVKHAGYLDGRHTLPLQILLHGLLALAFLKWTKPMRWWMDLWRRNPEAWNRLPSAMRSPRWPYIFAGGAIFFTLLPGLIRLSTPPQENLTYVLEAARWVDEELQPSVLICDHDRLVGYYSGNPYARWLGTPAKPLLAQVNFAQPHVLAYIFRPGLGEQPELNIGSYRAFAVFHSAAATHGDLMIFYTLPNTPIMRQGQTPFLTRIESLNHRDVKPLDAHHEPNDSMIQ
ncbi:MAG TPA: hypothetical protein VM008_22045 [Phycisphaerae bacterium]|nr:hypothetical protein [Phycisphaerae bacterium]